MIKDYSLFAVRAKNPASPGGSLARRLLPRVAAGFLLGARALTLTLCAALFLAPLTTLFAQGQLTPPAFPAPDAALNNLGQPIPNMKTLTQVEPRRPISSAPFTISTPGSYYLTQNLAVANGNAITVSSDGVALDLNGFTISSNADPAAGTAVLLAGARTNVSVRNGHIKGQVTFSGGIYSGTGFSRGISGNGGLLSNILVADLAVFGVTDEGIALGGGNSSRVERCVVQTAGGIGIIATVVHGCSARECGSTAIFGETVSDSTGVSTAGGTGIEGITISNSTGSSVSGAGITATNASNCRGISLGAGTGVNAQQTTNCRGQSSSGFGVFATDASNCTGTSNSGTGLSATNANNCAGESSTGAAGISSNGTVSYSRGIRSGGTAINAQIAIGCTGTGTITAPGGKFLGTP